MDKSSLFEALLKLSESKKTGGRKVTQPDKIIDAMEREGGKKRSADPRKITKHEGELKYVPTSVTGTVAKPSSISPTKEVETPRPAEQPIPGKVFSKSGDEQHWKDIVAQANNSRRFLMKSQDGTGDWSHLFTPIDLSGFDYSIASTFLTFLYNSWIALFTEENPETGELSKKETTTDSAMALFTVLNAFVGTDNVTITFPNDSEDPTNFLNVFFGVILPSVPSDVLARILRVKANRELLNDLQEKYTGNFLKLPQDNLFSVNAERLIKSGELLADQNCAAVLRELKDSAQATNESYPLSIKVIGKALNTLSNTKRVPNERIKNITDTIYYSLGSRLLPAYFTGLEIDDEKVRTSLFSGKAKAIEVAQDVDLVTAEASSFNKSQAFVFEEDPGIRKGIGTPNNSKRLSWDMKKLKDELIKKATKVNKTTSALSAARAHSTEISGFIDNLISNMQILLNGEEDIIPKIKAQIDALCDTLAGIPGISGISKELADTALVGILDLKDLTESDYTAIQILAQLNLNDVKSIFLSSTQEHTEASSEILEDVNFVTITHEAEIDSAASSPRAWAWKFMLELLSSSSTNNNDSNLLYKISVIDQFKKMAETHEKQKTYNVEKEKGLAEYDADIAEIEEKIKSIQAKIKKNPKQEEYFQDQIDALIAEKNSIEADKKEFSAAKQQHRAETATAKTRERSARGLKGVRNKRAKLLAQSEVVSMLSKKASDIYKDIFDSVRDEQHENTLKLMMMALAAPDKAEAKKEVEMFLSSIVDTVVSDYFNDHDALRILNPDIDTGSLQTIKQLVMADLLMYADAGLLATEAQVKPVSDFNINDTVIDLINLIDAISPNKETEENLRSNDNLSANEWNAVSIGTNGKVIPNFILKPAKSEKDGIYYKYFQGNALSDAVKSNTPVLLLLQAQLLDLLLPVLQEFKQGFTIESLLDADSLKTIDTDFPTLKEDIANFVNNIKQGISEVQKTSETLRKTVISAYGGKRVTFYTRKEQKEVTLPMDIKLLSNYGPLLLQVFNDNATEKPALIVHLAAGIDIAPLISNAINVVGTALNYVIGLRSTNLPAPALNLIAKAGLTDNEDALEIVKIQELARNYVNNVYGSFAAVLGFTGLGGDRFVGAKAKEKIHRNSIINSIFNKFSFAGTFLKDHLADYVDAFKVREDITNSSYKTAYDIAKELGIAFDTAVESVSETSLLLPKSLVSPKETTEETPQEGVISNENGIAKLNINALNTSIETIIRPLTSKLTGVARTNVGKDKTSKQAYMPVMSFKEYAKKGRQSAEFLSSELSRAIKSWKVENIENAEAMPAVELIDILKKYVANFNIMSTFFSEVDSAVSESKASKLNTIEVQKKLIEILKTLQPVPDYSAIPNTKETPNTTKIFFEESGKNYAKIADEILDPVATSPEALAASGKTKAAELTHDDPVAALLLIMAKSSLTIEQVAKEVVTRFDHPEELNITGRPYQQEQFEDTQELEKDPINNFVKLLLKVTSEGEYNWKYLLNLNRASRGSINVPQIYTTLFDKNTYILLNSEYANARDAADVLEKEKKELATQLEATKDQFNTISQERKQFENSHEDRSEDLRDIDSKIEAASQKIAAITQRIENAPKQLAAFDSSVANAKKISPEMQKRIDAKKLSLSTAVNAFTYSLNKAKEEQKQLMARREELATEHSSFTSSHSVTNSPRQIEVLTQSDALSKQLRELETKHRDAEKSANTAISKSNSIKNAYKIVVDTASLFSREANITIKTKLPEIISGTLEPENESEKRMYATIRTNKITGKKISELISLQSIISFAKSVSIDILEMFLVDEMGFIGLLEATDPSMSSEVSELLNTLAGILYGKGFTAQNGTLVSRRGTDGAEVLSNLVNKNLWLLPRLLHGNLEIMRNTLASQLKRSDKLLFAVNFGRDHRTVAIFDFKAILQLLEENQLSNSETSESNEQSE